ncbi:MAG: cytochrome c biogenesis protein CcsA [Flavobacteriales bacterium]|nr:cytochrome c biogenesis protein CcsA [Flavobacteriales bacterium]
MDIAYVGEHLIPGKIGNIAVIVSFVFSILATISYALGSKGKDLDEISKGSTDQGSWRSLGRLSFAIHGLAILVIIAALFHMLVNQMFEYHYVWQHSNSEMPFRYILSCFWEGQEGSFLLWAFWHVVLGSIMIFSIKKWEAPVMAVFCTTQVFLTSMLLGIYIGDVQIGSNPFAVLLREHPDFANLPLFLNENYLDQLDGRGLNPLLQNYWMTIHPPTLFLGFAAVTVPFSFAVAALLKNQFKDWLRPALPWTVFAVGILGLGILMGGAWAYEALSFGGFWAWDPVENAVLVPWLILVGGTHLMFIRKIKGSSLMIAFALILAAFILIIYSTYLTRSGVLGESSVHSFAEGLPGQLLFFLLLYAILPLVLLIAKLSKFKDNSEEDPLLSREFWMLMGSVVLVISALQIIAFTSIPVFNKIFGTNYAPPSNPIDTYNRWQIPIAIVISVLIGVSQFLNYKKTDKKKLKKHILQAAYTTVAISAICFFAFDFEFKWGTIPYFLLLFTSCFAVIGNLRYMFEVLKGKVKRAGGSIAHIGFGLIMLGALVSTYKQEFISSNSSGVDITSLGEDFNNHENILLFKNDTFKMGDYHVTYKGKTIDGINVHYEVEYLEKLANGFKPLFSLFPRVQTNPRMGNVSEPDTKHYLNKDIYTHVTYAELEERDDSDKSFKDPVDVMMAEGDTTFSTNSIITLRSLNRAVDAQELGLGPNDIAVSAILDVIDINSKRYVAEPIFVLKDQSYTYTIPDELEDLGLKFGFTKVDPEANKVQISVAERKDNSKEFIVMKAIVFPGINILWLGCILMFLGTVIATVNRLSS